jgi:chromosome segregation ATPase
MIEYATKQDVQAVTKDVQAVKQDVQALTNDVQAVAKDVQVAIKELRKELKDELAPIKAQYRDILVLNEQTHSRLDAILEYVSDAPDVKTRLTRLEETVDQEKPKTELNRYHLDILRHDLDAHQRRPHPAK